MGPQKALIDCPIEEIFYGGARGGGKTDGVLGKYAIKGETYGAGFNGIFFRRELPMCDDAIERSKQILSPLGWQYNASKYTWRSPKGARLRFRPLERISDAEKYQGQNISDACVEEAGNYPDPAPIDRLNGVLRSPSGVPTQLLLTGNPGGPGQHWIKTRYIKPCPGGMRVLDRQLPGGYSHRFVFIPSKVQDNLYLGDEYIKRLHLVGSAALVKAWLDGDWNAVEGAFFDCWGDQHILQPFAVPEHWTRFTSMDWGSARPFSVGWWAVATDDYPRPEGIIPRGALVRYREWYGVELNSIGDIIPNKGLKLTAEQVAQGIVDRETEEIAYRVADPSMFAQDGGPSLAERMAVQPFNIGMYRADNTRVGRDGHMGGWDQMRMRMIGEDRPMMYCFSTCTEFLRTIPSLQHDENKPEDLDTESEDHIADEARYAVMSRPYMTEKHEPEDAIEKFVQHRPTFNELRDRAAKQRARG